MLWSKHLRYSLCAALEMHSLLSLWKSIDIWPSYKPLNNISSHIFSRDLQILEAKFPEDYISSGHALTLGWVDFSCNCSSQLLQAAGHGNWEQGHCPSCSLSTPPAGAWLERKRRDGSHRGSTLGQALGDWRAEGERELAGVRKTNWDSLGRDWEPIRGRRQIGQGACLEVILLVQVAEVGAMDLNIWFEDAYFSWYQWDAFTFLG